MGPGVRRDDGSVSRASPLLRRNIPNPGRMRGEIVQAVGQMNALVRRWTLLDRQSGAPFLCRPDRPRNKTAAAVRAYVVQLVLDAVRTERAFVRADARFHSMRRKILVAIFAVRSELQRHGGLVGWNEADHRKSNAGRECRKPLDFGHPASKITDATPGAAASSSPSIDPARSTNVHAPRSGAASARC